jgi:hypothetical protein
MAQRRSGAGLMKETAAPEDTGSGSTIQMREYVKQPSATRDDVVHEPTLQTQHHRKPTKLRLEGDIYSNVDRVDDGDIEEGFMNDEDSTDEYDTVNFLHPHKSRHERRLQKWKGSPFAVGYTEATWMDERTRDPRDRSLPYDDTGCLCCSAQVCPLFGATRVGNMSVLKQSVEWVEVVVAVDDEEANDSMKNGANLTSDQPLSTSAAAAATNGPPQPIATKTVLRRVARPRLDIVVGPYWPMLCGITYPLIFGMSGWTLYSGLWHAKSPAPLVVWLLFVTLTVGLIVSLALTAFRDPGILLRTRTLVPNPHNPHELASWRWSDVADSYRPRDAWYDSDTAVIVEGFDHTYVLLPILTAGALLCAVLSHYTAL